MFRSITLLRAFSFVLLTSLSASTQNANSGVMYINEWKVGQIVRTVEIDNSNATCHAVLDGYVLKKTFHI